LNRFRFVADHPLAIAREIIAHCGRDLTFTYSRYEIANPGFQAIAPRSDVLRVRATDLTSAWLSERLSDLKPNEELAWHSRVDHGHSAFHIPMIDLVGWHSESDLRGLGQTLAAEMKLQGDFIFFNTGRSFHGYFPDLISEQDWPMYLGKLLLSNQDVSNELVDSRWVGHALTRGFAALRWSNNTVRYLAMPRLLQIHRALVTRAISA